MSSQSESMPPKSNEYYIPVMIYQKRKSSKIAEPIKGVLDILNNTAQMLAHRKSGQTLYCKTTTTIQCTVVLNLLKT